MKSDELARNSANRPVTRRFDDRAVSYWISKFGSKIRHIDRRRIGDGSVRAARTVELTIAL